MPSRVCFANASAAEVSNTNSGTYTNGVTLTYTPNASKDYVNFWQCLGQLAVATDSFHVQFFETSQRVFQTWEAKEVTTPPDYRSFGGMYKFTSSGSPSSMSFTIDIKREASTGTAKGKEFSIVALELGANDVYAEALSRTTTTTTATKLTANITPGTTGDYFIIFSAHMDCGAGTVCGIDAQVDGASILSTQDIKGAKDTTDRMPWVRVYKKTGWSNAAHTASIVFNDAEPGTNTVGCSEARILILRADDFEASYYAADFTGGASTSTTYQDRTTLTDTIATAGDHLILAAGSSEAVNSATVSSYNDFTEDGTTLQEAVAETPAASASDMAIMPVFRLRNLTAEPHTWLFRTKSETTSVNTRGNGSIAVLQIASSGNNGTLAVTLDAVTLAATGTSEVPGTLGVTLGAVTLSAVGTSSVAGTLAVTLDALTLFAAGSGELNVTLGALTLAATGTSTVIGALNAALGDLTLSAVGAPVISGAFATTLADVTLVAAGTATITGTLGTTLDALTLLATGETGDLPANELDVTLDDVTLTAIGTSTVTGTLGTTLDAVTLVAAGTSSVTGIFNSTLDNVTLAAAGTTTVTGALNITLDAVTLSAAGVATITGSLNVTLDALTLLAESSAATGSLDVTLDALALSAFGTTTIVGAGDITFDALTLEALGEQAFNTDAAGWWKYGAGASSTTSELPVANTYTGEAAAAGSWTKGPPAASPYTSDPAADDNWTKENPT